MTPAEPIETISAGELTELSLVELRRYRSRLTAEEDKVSYWRRLAHARIDMLEAQSRSATPLSFDDLVRVLGDTGTGQVRRALVRVAAAEPLPDLPELEQMWSTDVDTGDPARVADALERLRAAEQQLTAYRRALHGRLDAATAELIVRYRADPAAALSLIPSP